MGTNKVKGGGLYLALEDGESVAIGDDIKIIVQENNSDGSKRWALRIQAPDHIKIMSQRYEKSKDKK